MQIPAEVLTRLLGESVAVRELMRLEIERLTAEIAVLKQERQPVAASHVLNFTPENSHHV